MAKESKPEQIEAVPVTSIHAVTVSEDGKNIFLRFTTVQGEHNVMVPPEVLPNLMALCSQAYSQSRKIQKKDPDEKHVFPVEWWELGLTPDQQQLVLSFRMPGGMEMSYRVHRDRISQMRETLESMEGRTTSAPEGSTKQ